MAATDEDSGTGMLGSDVVIGSGDSIVGGSDTVAGASDSGLASDSGVGGGKMDGTVVSDNSAQPCQPSCAGKTCGDSDGCGGICSVGSGCATACGAWKAVNPDDPWDDSNPNYDGERGCSGSLIKDFGKVGLEASCRAKCEGAAATCCFRDHRGDHKSCRAYDGKLIVVGSCTGCTAASCK